MKWMFAFSSLFLFFWMPAFPPHFFWQTCDYYIVLANIQSNICPRLFRSGMKLPIKAALILDSVADNNKTADLFSSKVANWVCLRDSGWTHPRFAFASILVVCTRTTLLICRLLNYLSSQFRARFSYCILCWVRLPTVFICHRAMLREHQAFFAGRALVSYVRLHFLFSWFSCYAQKSLHLWLLVEKFFICFDRLSMMNDQTSAL